MQTSTLLAFLLSIILLPLATSTIFLSEFQPITDFPSSCTNAYNDPIYGCSNSDFSSPNSCSPQCFAALTAAGIAISNACIGEQAEPNTVIGRLFLGSGADFICSGQVFQSQSASASPSVSVTMESTFAGSTFFSTTSTPTTTSRSSTSRTTPRSTSSPITSGSPSSTIPRSSTSSSSTKLIGSSRSTTSTKSSSSHVHPETKSFLSTAVNDGSATVLTSQAQRTGSGNPDAFGGGGSPFEIGPNGTKGASEMGRLGWAIVIATLCRGFLAVLW